MLGARTGNTYELILFGILFLGWFLKTILGGTPKPGSPQHRTRPRHVPPEEPGPVPISPSEATRDIERAQERRKRERAVAEAVAPSSLTSDLHEQLTKEGHGLGSLEAAEVASREGALRHYKRIRERLGSPEGRSVADTVRAGVLWYEILGPPRAMRGPHRPPALTRWRAG